MSADRRNPRWPLDVTLPVEADVRDLYDTRDSVPMVGSSSEYPVNPTDGFTLFDESIGTNGELRTFDADTETWLPPVSAGGGGSLVHELASEFALGADHTVSGLTAGHVLRAMSPTDAHFAALQVGDLPTVDVPRGGTSRTSVTVGNLLIGAGLAALTLLAPGAAGGYVRSDGSAWIRNTIQVGDIPAHHTTHETGGSDAIAALAASVITSGQLALARGGSAADLSATGGTAQVVRQSSVGGAFTVSQLLASEIGSPAAVTRTNDTNVTVTLGGSPTVSALAAWSMTLGWTGQLGLSRGGSNADLSATGGASQVVRQSGVGSAFTVSQLTAADIGSGAALTRTNDTNVTLTLGGAPTTALLAATSLTMGWSGQLGLSRGGTNADLSATGGASRVLKQTSSGATVTVARLGAADIAVGAFETGNWRFGTSGSGGANVEAVGVFYTTTSAGFGFPVTAPFAQFNYNNTRGAVLWGAGSTYDVALQNQASNVALGVTANTLDLVGGGALTLAGAFNNAGNSLTTGAITGTSITGTGGMILSGSTSGYGGGEIRLNGGAGTENAISTIATGAPRMLFDHRGTGNTGDWQWRNGTGAGGLTAASLSSTGLFTSVSLTTGTLTVAPSSGSAVIALTRPTTGDTTQLQFKTTSTENWHIGTSGSGTPTLNFNDAFNGDVVTFTRGGIIQTFSGSSYIVLSADQGGIQPKLLRDTSTGGLKITGIGGDGGVTITGAVTMAVLTATGLTTGPGTSTITGSNQSALQVVSTNSGTYGGININHQKAGGKPIVNFQVNGGSDGSFIWDGTTFSLGTGASQALAMGALTATTLITADPGSGAGTWKLGKRQTAIGLVLLGTNYVEVNIDGTVVKLAEVT